MAQDAREIEINFPFAVHAGIGLNVVHWGYVEHQLDLLIAWHTNTRLGDSRPDHPRAISRKLRYLKEMEKDKTIAEYDRKKLRHIRITASDISLRRHDFTHSFMNIPETLADWTFTRFQYEGQNLTTIRKHYNLEKLGFLTKEIKELVLELSPLTKKLALEWMKRNRSRLTNSSAVNPKP